MKLKISAAEQLSTHFKSLRKAKGWSQSDLGKRLGLKQARVAQIEGDPGSISVDKLLQILHALGADLLVEAAQDDQDGQTDVFVQHGNYGHIFQVKYAGTEDKNKKSLNLIASSGKPASDKQAPDAAPTQAADDPAEGLE